MCEIALAVSGRVCTHACPAQQSLVRRSRRRGIAALSDANLILPLDHFLQVSIMRTIFKQEQALSKRLNLIQLVNNPAKYIPDNCYGHHGRCPCKNILSGVKFFRLNAKTAYNIFFSRTFLGFLGVLINFWV